MEDHDILKQLSVDLQAILHKYSEFVSKEQGLIVRPKVTSSSERARKLKQKYKRIAKQTNLYLRSNLGDLASMLAFVTELEEKQLNYAKYVYSYNM